MGDPLLDEATRVADAYQREITSGISPIADLLRALVERVQAAEQEAETQAGNPHRQPNRAKQ